MGLFKNKPARVENPFASNHAKVKKVQFNEPLPEPSPNPINPPSEEKLGAELMKEVKANIERDDTRMFRNKEGIHQTHFYNPLVKLYYIVQKDLKLLIRSRASALIFLFGPLFIMFLIGFAFNTSAISGLTIGVYSDAYSELSENLVTSLSDEQYQVLKLGSQDECVNAVKFGDVQVCAVLPSNMVLDNSQNNEVQIFVDNSRINFANQVSNDIATKLMSQSEELSGSMVLDILTTLDQINQEIANQKSSLSSIRADNSEMAEKLDALNVASIEFDFTAISEELTSLQNENTSADYGKLEGLLKQFEDEYKELETQLTTTQNTLTEVEEKIDTGATGLASLSNSLNVIANDIASIKITNVDNIVSPVKNSIEPVSSNNNYLLYILPSLLVLVIMFVSLLISSSTIISEKTSRSNFRNFISPTSDKLFMSGNFISNMLIIIFQLTIIFGVVYFFFSDVAFSSYALSALVLGMLATFFIFIGMTLGSVFNTKQTVTIAAISLGIILLFFSNVILPLETLSEPLRSIAMFNPFVLGESMIKKILLFDSGFSTLKGMFLALGGMIMGSVVLALISRESTKRFNR